MLIPVSTPSTLALDVRCRVSVFPRVLTSARGIESDAASSIREVSVKSSPATITGWLNRSLLI